jgi:NAD(P)-dependent dehydrogenase (short-subunit alcohol dehydrogenase family)
MNIKGKAVVVTGGANGIGRALCEQFAREGARKVVVADLDAANAEEVARAIGGIAVATDVADEAQVRRLVSKAEEACGAIDLFCSNSGIVIGGGFEVPDADWERIWSINFKAHLYAARAVIPAMLARGGGYLLQTVSAAGLITSIGSAPYAVTKHAALAFAEWLSITHADAGLKVSCLCPMGVRTNMLRHSDELGASFLLEDAIEPEAVADTVIAGLADERFLILPHPQVAEFFGRKASDYDRWLRGMRRLRTKLPKTAC